MSPAKGESLRTVIDILRSQGFVGGLREGESLADHCSIAVGGAAALFAEPEGIEDLRLLLAVLRKSGVTSYILGGGTNVMFNNGGYPGCVFKLGEKFGHIVPEGDTTIRSGAAVSTSKLLSHCRENGLGSLEFLAGIPGTLGGAVSMNAGVPGDDMAGVVRRIDILSGSREGEIIAREIDGLDFKYRELAGLEADDVIIDVQLVLTRSDSNTVMENMNSRLKKRRKTQPLGIPSAGCWFKNPEGDSAGRLIDAAGLKGKRSGGAAVSNVHANFLVNTGNASAKDFQVLADSVKETVKKRFGVVLEEEVHVI